MLKLKIFYPAFLESKRLVFIPWSDHVQINLMPPTNPTHNSLTFAVINHSQEVVGCANIYNIDLKAKTAFVGCWLEKSFQNKTLGEEIIQAMCSYASKDMNINKIYLEIDKSNLHAKKLANKMDFKLRDISGHKSLVFYKEKENYHFF